MQDSMTQLRSVLRPTGSDPDGESDFGLPSLTDGEYQAYGRPASKPIFSIHFISNKGEVRSFQYQHLDSDSRFTAEGIELRFMGMEPSKITIRGRNLWRLYDYIHQHRCQWTAEALRDVAADRQPIIIKVEYEDLGAQTSEPDARKVQP